MPTTISQHAPLHNPQSPSVEPLAVRPRAAWIMLGCSNSHGYELLARGELDSYTDGSARKITVASIKRYIARRLAKSGNARVRKSPRKKSEIAV